MNSRRTLLALVGLLGTVAVLAFPGAGSALLGTYTIELTSTGPSPSALAMSVGVPLTFTNSDTVAHTVAFADSSCAGDVAPGGKLECSSYLAGDYTYSVDGSVDASVTVAAADRRVTLTVNRHGFRLGSIVRLHGILKATTVTGGGPPLFGPTMPVTVLARSDRFHPWHRVGSATAKPLKRPILNRQPYSVWHLSIKFKAHTTYKVVANSQPKGGQYWENAESRLFGLYVRRR
jgi:plastocyanin